MQFVPTAEGFYNFIENRYIYQYKDHLGNTRLSFAKNQTTHSVEVLDKNDYYPFGMNDLDSNAGSYFGQSSYKNYKYNGKELQETGVYDYGQRHYMSDIRRFNRPDKFGEKYFDKSSYSYGANDPLKYVDVRGDSLNVANNLQTQEYLNNSVKSKNSQYINYDSKGNVTLNFGDMTQKQN